MADPWTELRQLNDRLERDLETARRAIERFVLCADTRLCGGMSDDQNLAYRGLVSALAVMRAPERLKRAHG